MPAETETVDRQLHAYAKDTPVLALDRRRKKVKILINWLNPDDLVAGADGGCRTVKDVKYGDAKLFTINLALAHDESPAARPRPLRCGGGTALAFEISDHERHEFMTPPTEAQGVEGWFSISVDGDGRFVRPDLLVLCGHGPDNVFPPAPVSPPLPVPINPGILRLLTDLLRTAQYPDEVEAELMALVIGNHPIAEEPQGRTPNPDPAQPLPSQRIPHPQSIDDDDIEKVETLIMDSPP